MSEETKKPEEVKVVPVATPETVAPIEATITPAAEPVVLAPTPEAIADVAIEAKAVEAEAIDTAKEIRKMLSDDENLALAEAAVQDNQLKFEHNSKQYRVRKSTYVEKQEANKYRHKAYIQLLRDPDTLLEKDLRALYKTKGVDIDGIEREIQELYNTQQTLMLALGKAIQKKSLKVELEKYKEEIVQCNSSIGGLNQEKQILLEYSLENRILMDVYGFMVWQIAEVKENGEWKRVWTSYEACQADPDVQLLTLVTKHGAVIVTDEMTSGLGA